MDMGQISLEGLVFQEDGNSDIWLLYQLADLCKEEEYLLKSCN